MAGINKVIILGNLGRDPESRTTNFGTVVNLAIATSESWTDKASGERKERTEWHRVVIYNERLGEVAEKYLHKGSKVYIEGQNETRKYTNKDGVEVYTTEVVLRQFRGELQLVDSRGQDDDRGGRDEPRDRGREPTRDARGRDDKGRDDRGATRGRDDRDDRRPARDDRDSRGAAPRGRDDRDARGGRDEPRGQAREREEPRGRSTNGDGREAAPRDDDRRPAGRQPSQTEQDIEDLIPF